MRQTFQEIQTRVNAGQVHYRTPAQVQARTETQCHRSPVSQLVTVEAQQAGDRIILHWQIKVNELRETMQQACPELAEWRGRYLIVTNDPTLSPQCMFELYRAKSGVEKDFRLCKNQLQVSLLYVHKDPRIQSMLLLNVLALLAYTILERQARQAGLALATRRIMEQLDSLNVIETQTVDGSCFYRLTGVSPEQAQLIAILRTLFPLEPDPLPLPAG